MVIWAFFGTPASEYNNLVVGCRLAAATLDWPVSLPRVLRAERAGQATATLVFESKSFLQVDIDTLIRISSNVNGSKLSFRPVIEIKHKAAVHITLNMYIKYIVLFGLLRSYLLTLHLLITPNSCDARWCIKCIQVHVSYMYLYTCNWHAYSCNPYNVWIGLVAMYAIHTGFGCIHANRKPVYMALDWQQQQTAFSKRGVMEGRTHYSRAIWWQRPARLRTEDFVGLSKWRKWLTQNVRL